MCVCMSTCKCTHMYMCGDQRITYRSQFSLHGSQVWQQAALFTGAFCFLSPTWWLRFTTAAFVTPSPELWCSNVSALRAPGFTWDGSCCPWGDKAQSIHQVPSLTWKKNMAVVKVSETPSNLYPADSVLLAKTEMPLK